MSSSCRSSWAEGPARRGLRGRLLTAVLLAPTLLCGACTIDAQSAPVPVEAPTATTVARPTRAGVPLTIQVYFVQGEHLARVTRTVPPGAGLEPSLGGLAVPLTMAQTAQGLRTAIPGSSSPLKGHIVDGIARIDLPAGFERISIREQSLAMAQLVFTVTANSLATSVQLVQGSRALPMPSPNGQLISRPVTRLDYAAYDPTQ